jgi:type III pantothenate kinase
MILLVDAGNTRVKWGLYDGAAFHATGATPIDDLDSLLDPWRANSLSAIYGVNVAGAAAGRRLEEIAPRRINWLRSRADQCGLRNGYADPESLGVDRWVMAIGAWHHAGPCLIVGCGTATTLGVISPSGVFAGGLIAPGFDLMRQSLAQATDGLPMESGSFTPLPISTADAIWSGCLDAQVGVIERFRTRHLGMFNAIPPRCLITGGAAALITPQLSFPHEVVDDLVLRGIAKVAATCA